MLDNFQLIAIVIKGNESSLFRVPVSQTLQNSLAAQWFAQMQAFTEGTENIPFDAGYNPESHERFAIDSFVLPDWLSAHTSLTVPNLPSIGENEERLSHVKALAGFAKIQNGKEIILFQNFNRSHVIKPGNSLFLKQGVYETNNKPVLTLSGGSSAIYFSEGQRLIFHHFRSVNVYLPLAEYYEEAAEEDIREILGHASFAPENADAIAKDASQWFRKRFAILRDSKVLEDYTVQHIADHAQGYDVELQLENNKIIFPADKTKAKKLLQFLNEELYKGAITEKLYETNSKRETEA